MSQDELKQLAGRRAAEYIMPLLKADSIVGVGTGSTANHFIDALAESKHKFAGCVASSNASAERLAGHGIRVEDLNSVDEVVVYVDGADECNARLELIKGGGGALTREKIVASVAREFVCIVDESKMVDVLGTFPLPVEVIPMARSAVARQLVPLGGEPVYRENFVTDNGNIILDVHGLAIDNACEMEDRLNAITGVVTQGLFAKRPADLLLLASADGVAETRREEVKVKEVKVLVCSPGRNFVTVKVVTDEGIYGLGDATLNGRELAVATYLEEHVAPCLIGRDPHDIEDIWQYLYKGVYWRRGAVTMAAIGAIDMALWDIKGKVAGLPVYQLLGGRSRTAIGLYAHASGANVDETLSKAEKLMGAGFKAIRLQSAIPGLEVTYGVTGDKKDYYDLQSSRPVPPEEVWSTQKYFSMVEGLFSDARQRLGNEVRLLHDVHNRLTPVESARLGKLLEPYDLLFLEDASIAENQHSYEVIRQHTTTPLAIGETYNTIWDCKELIEKQLIDYIRTAATHAGGITGMRRIADFAGIHNVKTAPHGAPDLSPVCFAAHIHLNTWTPNFGVQEFVGFGGQECQEVFRHDFKIENGMAYVSDAPGLGIDFDEKAAQAYPYKRSYLPVSRLEDGTLWNW